MAEKKSVKKKSNPIIPITPQVVSPTTLTMRMDEPHARRAVRRYMESVNETNRELAEILECCIASPGCYQDYAGKIQELSNGMLKVN